MCSELEVAGRYDQRKSHALVWDFSSHPAPALLCVALFFDKRGDLMKSLSYAFHGHPFKATDKSLTPAQPPVAPGGLQ